MILPSPKPNAIFLTQNNLVCNANIIIMLPWKKNVLKMHMKFIHRTGH